MKTVLSILTFLVSSWTAVAEEPVARLIDPRVIEATMAEREAWVVDRLALNPKAFDGAYGWILESRELGSNEVHQLADLFFYSSWQSCGYFDRPVRKDYVWVCRFHSGFPPVDGFDVIVDAKTGFAWQEGQSEKIDLLKLIRFIEEKRKKTAEPGATDNPDDARRV